jgi:hypothetical protein
MQNSTRPRMMILFAAIASMLSNPLGNQKELKNARREVHFMTGGGNAEFHPQHKKFKPSQKVHRNVRKKSLHTFIKN